MWKYLVLSIHILTNVLINDQSLCFRVIQIHILQLVKIPPEFTLVLQYQSLLPLVKVVEIAMYY